MSQLINVQRLNLSKANTRDLSSILPFIEQGNWVTSISLAKMMYATGEYNTAYVKKASAILSKLYHEAEVLERKEKRQIYFHNVMRNTTPTWAYRLKRDLVKEHEV